MKMMHKILLITGTPGVGKTTLANSLRQLGYIVYNLFDLASELKCIGDTDEKRDAVIVDDDCLYKKLPEWIARQSAEFMVFEGHFADVVPEEYLDSCLVLSPPIDILRPRLLARGYSEDKIMENIEAHIMKECYYDALEYYGPERVSEITILDEQKLLDHTLQLISNITTGE